MSSILDALRKLEADKAETPAQDDLVMDSVAAERDLVGEGLMRTGTTVRITPGLLIACIVGLSVLVGMVATGGVAFWWTRSAGETGPIPSAVASASPAPAVTAPPVSTAPVTPVPSYPPPSPPVPAQPPQPSAPTAVVSPQPVIIEPPTPQPAVASPEPVTPSLQPSSDDPAIGNETRSPKVPRSGKGTRTVARQEEIRVAAASTTELESPVRETEVRTEVPKISEVKEAVKPTSTKEENVDVFSLPVLKESDKARFGLSNLRVNMVRPAGKNAPYASAVINLRPVYVGERIPNTSATLVAVEDRGIAIEVGDTGERFHVRF